MKVALLADGGKKIGLGHLGRCLALAQAFRKHYDTNPVFITPDADGQRWIRQNGFSAIPSNHKTWDILIGDSYRFRPGELKTLRSRAGTLLLIDDLGQAQAPCDWILNSSISAHKISYANTRASGLLLGPRFHPLRKEFWPVRYPQKRSDALENLLIILGGGDGWGILTSILETARKALPQAHFHVVVGPLTKLRLPQTSSTTLYYAPLSLRSILEKCDLAISGGGQTLFELAWAGLPAIAVILADNQIFNARSFQKLGTLKIAGTHKNPDLLRNTHRLLTQLALDGKTRKDMSQAGSGLLDGKGALRIARTILKYSKP